MIYITLLTSISTLFCCALPIIAVAIGAGAAFASLTANLPIISWLGSYANYLIILAIIFTIINGYILFIRPQSCPSDKKLAKKCRKVKKTSKILWVVSVAIILIAIFFKYILIYFY
jgi:succinate dehydrogenase/fumarate reductase cytochrome b subunit